VEMLKLAAQGTLCNRLREMVMEGILQARSRLDVGGAGSMQMQGPPDVTKMCVIAEAWDRGGCL
jgi:hypothetical protein